MMQKPGNYPISKKKKWSSGGHRSVVADGLGLDAGGATQNGNFAHLGGVRG
jgi:hypothetical protein